MASRVRSPFRGSRARVVHRLLLAPGTWFGATRLAEQAGVSPGTASVVLRHLEQRELVHTRGTVASTRCSATSMRGASTRAPTFP